MLASGATVWTFCCGLLASICATVFMRISPCPVFALDGRSIGQRVHREPSGDFDSAY
jgi:hypothetical protein